MILNHSGDAAVVADASINASSSGNNVVVARVPGYKIRVLQYKIICAGQVTVTWESSGGTILDGPCTFSANSGERAGCAEMGQFQDAPANEDLVINLSAAVQVGGSLKYALL